MPLDFPGCAWWLFESFIFPDLSEAEFKRRCKQKHQYSFKLRFLKLLSSWTLTWSLSFGAVHLLLYLRELKFLLGNTPPLWMQSGCEVSSDSSCEQWKGKCFLHLSVAICINQYPALGPGALNLNDSKTEGMNGDHYLSDNRMTRYFLL
jgi:hypothetical protein